MKSFLYGKQRVPFTEEDLQNLTYSSGAKHFQMLGFIGKDLIPRHQFMGPVLIALPKKDDAVASLALSAFVHACHETQTCGLARLVSRKNASPKFVVLMPRIKASMECFIINELPFYEDCRKYPFSGFSEKVHGIKFKVSHQQLTAAKNLVMGLDLMKGTQAEDDDEDEGIFLFFFLSKIFRDDFFFWCKNS